MDKICYTNEEYVDFVCDAFDEMKALFLRKNKQYAGEKWLADLSQPDPLANFKQGALIQMSGLQSAAESVLGEFHKTHVEDEMLYRFMFDEATAYQRKHIFHLFNNGVDGINIDESLKDIAVYCVIELFLWKKYQEAVMAGIKQLPLEKDVEENKEDVPNE